ncbi:MAG: diacylglycerol kinase family protein [Bacteroidetes bacterium]|nr:diacylglycerol kinase family protein [Bacteroidota bacterium]
MKQNFFSIKTWVNRFRYAIEGLISSFRTEQVVWIHFIATLLVVVLAIVKRVSGVEAIAITFAAGFVWVAELLNTAIEKLADKVTTGYSEKIKLVKDISAAAVLVASIVALITGLIIFIPKF